MTRETDMQLDTTLHRRIENALHTLHPAERRVAEAVLADPAQVRSSSITALADALSVSQTTIMRFCRSLGYSGYAEFKLAVVEALASEQKLTFAGSHSEVLANDDIQTVQAKVLQMNMKALAETSASVDSRLLERAISVLLQADKIEIVGVGSSLPIALDLYYRLLRTGLNPRCSVDSHFQAINASVLCERDACMAISYSGLTRETLDAVRAAKEAGAATLCITNAGNSPLARLVDIALVTRSLKTKWLDEAVTGRIVQLSVLDVICVAIAQRRQAKLQDIFSRIDRVIVRKQEEP
ncbi:MAG TPA: MurR/RpiR family transcriptional regulator [Firmicutes bacterium]|nr:MurR/RpiR family transcriptional regulator [Bacillota bacterium]